MDFESPVTSGKVKLVIALVLLGMGVLAAGAYVAFSKRSGASVDPADEPSRELSQWCELRRAWAKRVDPVVSDILLKQVQAPDDAQKLATERNKLCQQFAKKIRERKFSDSRIRAVEVALIKEGKVRANVTVEIGNAVAHVASEDPAAVREALTEAQQRLKQRIGGGRATADAEVAQRLGAIPGCRGIFRGPLTDADTAENPYVSWDELELRRTSAVKALHRRVDELEPREQLTNQVYHKLIGRYGKTLRECYRKAKRAKPQISKEMGLRVRLKRNGEVKTMGIEWMDSPGEKLLDCVLEAAARDKWRMPRPLRDGDFVVVKLDFSAI